MELFLGLLISALPVTGTLATDDADSVSSYLQLATIEVTAPLKQRGLLFDQPVAGTTYNLQRIESGHLVTQKDFSLSTPNLYLPDYGSRMTGTIYIRGIGARMEQPSMGLYLDNVPILNKNNYEFDFYDLRRADILRGPQGTLYGRNSIGGVMNLYTLSPFEYQGVRAYAGYGNGNTWDARVSLYRREGERFGWSLAVSHHGSDGFFTNTFDNSNADKIRSGGLRGRFQWKWSERLFVDNTVSFNNVKQNGFAYAYYDTETGITGQVDHNDPCKYDRTGVINGTTVRYDGPKFRLESVTSYQLLDDRMTLDQDFLPVSMFTLVQAQKEHAVTQELIFRSPDEGRRWQWLTGAFGFYKHNRMNAPVTFLHDGIEQLIEANANYGLQMFYPGETLYIREDEFVISSRFKLPSYGLAGFHQSTYEAGRWRFTAGIRFDYEHVGLRYDNHAAFHYLYTRIDDRYHLLTSEMSGRESLSYLEVLPRAAVQYGFTNGNIYANISKGYKAGGINTQIFSDILQNKLTEDLVTELGIDARVKSTPITYEPERNWNWELGTHLSLADGRLILEGAVFYILSRNQQITVFPPGQSTGRMMSNAGKSRSYGTELSVGYTTGRLRFEGSYGFTDARFIEFDDNQNDYKGNKVPYAPRNTAYLMAEYRHGLSGGFIDEVSVRADWRGAGKTYWNEDNSASQGFYNLLGAGITLKAAGGYYLDFWGRNLGGTRYNTFYFKSIGNTFVQKGKPRQWGISLRLNL